MYDQIGNINEEIGIIKRNQIQILELKGTVADMKKITAGIQQEIDHGQHSKKHSWVKWGNIKKRSQMWSHRAWELRRQCLQRHRRKANLEKFPKKILKRFFMDWLWHLKLSWDLDKGSLPSWHSWAWHSFFF